MVSFALSIGLALLATAASAMALPTTAASFMGPTATSSVGPAGLPSSCCAFYEVVENDSCDSIVNQFDNTFTSVDLYTWNQDRMTNKCFIWVGEMLCVGVSGYVYPGPIEAGDIYTAAQNPAPVQPETIDNCTKYEYSLNGMPYFSQMLSDNQITEDQWNSWNWPNSTIMGYVWSGYFSCVSID